MLSSALVKVLHGTLNMLLFSSVSAFLNVLLLRSNEPSAGWRECRIACVPEFVGVARWRSSRQLSKSARILFFESLSFLTQCSSVSAGYVRKTAPLTCNQSAMCAFKLPTCLTLSCNTSIAWPGWRVAYNSNNQPPPTQSLLAVQCLGCSSCLCDAPAFPKPNQLTNRLTSMAGYSCRSIFGTPDVCGKLR